MTGTCLQFCGNWPTNPKPSFDVFTLIDILFVRRLEIYFENLQLHSFVEAYFSGIKTILDILMQLLSTENIVSSNVHGFHKDKNDVGGKILKQLNNK